MGKRIPTIILTGFLGAGKTTLLNRLIEHYQSQRTVLLINEFGQVGIDGELLVAGNYDKIELNKGSLFCICVRTDFIYEVERIANEIQPDLLIVEATGIADTSEMEKMLGLPNLIDKIHLQSCLCLVDCQSFLKIKDNLLSPATQVRSADLVLVNKIDLVSAEQVEAVVQAVREFSPDVPIELTAYAEFPMEALKTLAHPELPPVAELGDGRPDLVASVTLQHDGSLTADKWNEFIVFIKPHIMRFKGFVTIDNMPFHVEATADSWAIAPAENGTVGRIKLVLIGRGFRESEVMTQFEKALV
ncbi:GTP-binding protein [bacterium]|nr:GTP-binding protein [bacterium]